jgi:cytidylate kinase
VYLITGPMAAGKATVAGLLASRFERGVHLEGDVFRRSIVSGRKEITPELSPEAISRLRLRYRLAAAAADSYCEAGFTVALDDVVAVGIWLDTSALTPEETVAEILSQTVAY